MTGSSDCVRVAAVGDIHVGDHGDLPSFDGVDDSADLLLLAGDLTRTGTRAEVERLAARGMPFAVASGAECAKMRLTLGTCGLLPSFEKQHMGDAGSEVDCGRGAELHDPRAGRGGLGVTTAAHKYASPAPRPKW